MSFKGWIEELKDRIEICKSEEDLEKHLTCFLEELKGEKK